MNKFFSILIFSSTLLTLLNCGGKKSKPVQDLEPPKKETATPSALENLRGVEGWTFVTNESTQHTVAWYWLTPIKDNTYLSLKMAFFVGGEYETIKSIDVFSPDMPAHGHGTPTAEQTIRPSASRQNRWFVEGVFLIMGGYWEIETTYTDSTGTKHNATLPLEVP